MALLKGAAIIGIAPDVVKFAPKLSTRVSYMEFMSLPKFTTAFFSKRLHAEGKKCPRVRLIIRICNGQIACWIVIARV